MSLLPAGTFASPNITYYDSGGGGGGGSVSSVSTLISPTLISTVGGTSILNYTGSVNSIVTENNNGIFTMSAQPTVPGQQPFIAYNAAQNLTTIGDGVQNILGGVVTTRQELLVTDPRGPGNNLALTPIDATNSLIAQGCATNGVINFGTSLAQRSTLVVYDQGATAGVVQAGGNGGAPLELLGGTAGVAISNAPIIRPGVAVNGTMRIGSSFGSSNQIVVSDLSGVYFGSIFPPIWNCMVAQTVLAGATRGAGTYGFSLAGAFFTDGMYMCMTCPFPPTGPTDPSTYSSAFSFTFYVKNNLCVAGGVGSNTSGNIYIQPQSGLAGLDLVVSGANCYLSVVVIRQTGVIAGF